MTLTLVLVFFEIRLAHETLVLQQVEFVTSFQFTPTHEAGEALEVVHVVLRSSHYLRRRDTQTARSTLRTIPPVNTTH